MHRCSMNLHEFFKVGVRLEKSEMLNAQKSSSSSRKRESTEGFEKGSRWFKSIIADPSVIASSLRTYDLQYLYTRNCFAIFASLCNDALAIFRPWAYFRVAEMVRSYWKLPLFLISCWDEKSWNITYHYFPISAFWYLAILAPHPHCHSQSDFQRGKCLSALAMDICLPCLLFSAVLPEARVTLDQTNYSAGLGALLEHLIYHDMLITNMHWRTLRRCTPCILNSPVLLPKVHKVHFRYFRSSSKSNTKIDR